MKIMVFRPPFYEFLYIAYSHAGCIRGMERLRWRDCRQMKLYVYVKGIKFGDVKRAIGSLLDEVDQGKHDEQLKAAGITRPADVSFADSVTFDQPQGLSPDDWAKIIIIFAPFAAQVGKDIWKIVILPKLKRLFRDDRVQDEDPKEIGKKRIKK
jgi:hypothetical protein